MLNKTKNNSPNFLIQINAPDYPEKAQWDKIAKAYLDNTLSKKFVAKLLKEVKLLKEAQPHFIHYSPAVFNFYLMYVRLLREQDKFDLKYANYYVGSEIQYYENIKYWLQKYVNKGDNYQKLTSGRAPENISAAAAMAEVNKSLAGLFYAKGNYPTALEFIEEISPAPNQIQHYKAFAGQCLYMEGRPWAALTALEECLKHLTVTPSPDNEDIKTYAFLVKARALYQLKKYPELKIEIAHALACKPANKTLISANKTLRRALNISSIINKAGEIISKPFTTQVAAALRKNTLSKNIGAILKRPLYVNFIEPENDILYTSVRQRHNDNLAPAKEPV